MISCAVTAQLICAFVFAYAKTGFLIMRLISFVSDVIILIFCGLISGLFSVAACRVHRQYRKRRIHFRTLSEEETSFRYSDLNNGDKVRLVDDTSDDEFDVP